MRGRRLLSGSLAVLAVAVGLAACTPPAAQLPDGVSVVVYQPRTEIQSGRFAIQVTNGSDVPVTVLRAELDSPDYSAPIVWERHDARLSPGVAIDLRVDPVAPACAEPSTDPLPVVLDFRLEDGRVGHAEVGGSDPFNQFPRIPDSLCLGILLDRVAEIATIRVESDGQPRHPGRLVLSVDPTGEPGPALWDAVQSTILVSLLDDERMPVPQLAVGVDVASLTAAQEFDFPIAPGRCDPHAIAEDKVGTLFPIAVTVGGRAGTFRLPSTDEFRAQVYAFVEAYCA